MKRYLALALTVVAVVIACPALAEQGSIRRYMVNPQSNLFGKGFDEWMGLYWHWFWPDFYSVPGPSDQVGRVSYIHVPIGGGEISTAVRKGQFLVVPLAVLTGERYDNPNVPDDDPADFFPDQYLDFKLHIDGTTVLDGDEDDVTQYLFDVATFDPPFIYPEPEFRYHDDELGVDVNAVGAVWSQGTGCILYPLPVGEHTIVIDLNFPIFGEEGQFTNTIHVTVSK